MGEYVIIIVVCIKLFKEGKLKTKYNESTMIPVIYENLCQICGQDLTHQEIERKRKVSKHSQEKKFKQKKKTAFLPEGYPLTQADLQLRLPLYRNYLLEDTLLRRKDLFFPPDWAVRFTIIWSKITERALQRDKIC